MAGMQKKIFLALHFFLLLNKDKSESAKIKLTEAIWVISSQKVGCEQTFNLHRHLLI